jgi:YbgC/YbaW family acyl-CoA thioester hydrolase
MNLTMKPSSAPLLPPADPPLHVNDFRCLHRLRVRWAEVDMQKIVFNAHYLMYFDTAVADYWRALALPYESAMQRLDGDLFVRKASLEFHASARMDDLLDIGMRCQRVGTSSMVFQGALFRAGSLLVSCELVYVFADVATQRPSRVPDSLRALLSDFEEGQAVSEIVTGNWDELGEGAGALRTDVFIKEQGVDPSLEWDEHDAGALHAVARNRLGQIVATGRLLPATDGQARIGRMAVERALRGGSSRGHGAAVLKALEDAARARGDSGIALHAQRSAERFYARLGYATVGEEFEEAGIAHIEMRKTLKHSV